MELCGSLPLFLALPPEAGPEGGAAAGGDEGDPVAAEAVMVSPTFCFRPLECCSFQTGLLKQKRLVAGGGNVKNIVLSTSHHMPENKRFLRNSDSGQGRVPVALL